MTAATSTTQKPKAAPPKSRFGFVGMVAAIFLAIGAVFLLPATLILVVGLVPTAVAYFVDTSREKSLGPTVLYLNLAGIFPALLRLWKQGFTVPNSLDIITQPIMLFFMFMPAAFGWVLYLYVPHIVSGILRRRAEARIKTLEEDQQTLIKEWGPEVAGSAMQSAKDEKAAAKAQQAKANEEASFNA